MTGQFLYRRRDFIALIGGAAVAWPLAARAQPAERMRRVTVLMSTAKDDPQDATRLAAFARGLEELGCLIQLRASSASGHRNVSQFVCEVLAGREPAAPCVKVAVSRCQG